MVRLLAGILTFVVAALSPAHATEWPACNQQVDVESRIRACSRLIADAKQTRKNCGIAYNNRGVAYYTKGDYGRAIAHYDQAIRLDPKNASAYENRSIAYAEKGVCDKAISDFTKAIEIDPNTCAPSPASRSMNTIAS